MRKKLLGIFLCMTMMISVFTGCTKTDSSSENENKTDSNVTADAVDTKKVYVTPEWVKSVIDGNQKESENYIILEASWGTYKDSPDYTKGHIPGAIHVDTSSVESEPYWNISAPDVVEKNMLDLGVTKDKTVILYSADPSAVARVAFTYLWAGVDNVKIMNGGMEAWENAGYESDTNVEKASPAKDFGTKVPAHPEYVLSIDEVKDNLENDSNFKLVSIRSKQEFLGETSGYNYIDRAGEPEGAVWGRAGSDPYNMEDYLNEDGTVITPEQMFEMWSDLDFTMDNELSFYCGTGWRASIPWLLCYEAGYTNMTVYDGGWYQWQDDGNNKVQVGDPDDKNCEHTTVKELPTDKAEKLI